jgi:hypothetical protein
VLVNIISKRDWMQIQSLFLCSIGCGQGKDWRKNVWDLIRETIERFRLNSQMEKTNVLILYYGKKGIPPIRRRIAG